MFLLSNEPLLIVSRRCVGKFDTELADKRFVQNLESSKDGGLVFFCVGLKLEAVDASHFDQDGVAAMFDIDDLQECAELCYFGSAAMHGCQAEAVVSAGGKKSLTKHAQVARLKDG